MGGVATKRRDFEHQVGETGLAAAAFESRNGDTVGVVSLEAIFLERYVNWHGNGNDEEYIYIYNKWLHLCGLIHVVFFVEHDDDDDEGRFGCDHDDGHGDGDGAEDDYYYFTINVYKLYTSLL